MSGNSVEDGVSNGQKAVDKPSSQENHEESERKARVDALWEKMNSGVPCKAPKMKSGFPAKLTKTAKNKAAQKKAHSWMMNLGFAPKMLSNNQGTFGQRPEIVNNGTSEEAKKVAAEALSAVRDATSAAIAAATAGRGKVEITEVRDFAGEEVKMKKLVDANSEAAEKAKSTAGPSSALDNILEQIKKKQKLSVLDKTKKDWGEYKEENKGLDDELDAYKKSSNQYLDKVSFLQRTDMREFEKERDARLATQAKRRVDMSEDDL